MRMGKAGKREFLDWLSSPAGTSAQPYLRAMTLRLPTRLWFLLRKHRIPAVIYLPSPPFVKVLALKRYARQYGLKTFVETGTFMGNTTASMADVMARCITVELSNQLHERALARFRDRANIHCVLGNSAQAIPAILQSLDEPALFWLDAHYSGGITADGGADPIIDELTAIFSHPVYRRSVVLVDDARGHSIDRIGALVPKSHTVSVRNDIIRIVPREPVEVVPSPAG
jgi:hypothetical protein